MIYNAPMTIPADGSRDVTADLLDWIAVVPNGTPADRSVLVLPDHARYKVDGTLLLYGREYLDFEGNGTTLDVSAPGRKPNEPYSNRRHVWLKNCQDMVIRGLQIRGGNTVSDVDDKASGAYLQTLEFEHAFALESCRRVELLEHLIDAVWGDGVYVGQPNTAFSEDITVARVDIDRVGRQGIAFTGVIGGLIDDAILLHGRRAGIDLEPGGSNGVVRNVEIRNFSLNCRLLAFASKGRGDVSNIHIHDGTVVRSGVPWVYVYAQDATRRHDWLVEDVTCEQVFGSPAAAMFFVNVDNARVARTVSRVSVRRSRIALEFRGCGGLLGVHDNDFTGACAPYYSNPAYPSGPVIESNNTYSACP